MDKDDFQRQKAIKEGKRDPKPPTERDWQEAAEAKRMHAKIREAYYRHSSSLYYFEETMGYAEHLFDKPEEPERRVFTAQELKEMERAAEQDFIAGLREQVARSKRGG